MSTTETFHNANFRIVFTEDPPNHAYDADVSDRAGSSQISHPYGMLVLEGSLSVRRPDDVVEERSRGFVSADTIPTGRWEFTTGAQGCRHVCVHAKDDTGFTKTAMPLAMTARSGDLSGFDWVLVADGEAQDVDGPLRVETMIDLRNRHSPYHVVATAETLLLGLVSRAAL